MKPFLPVFCLCLFLWNRPFAQVVNIEGARMHTDTIGMSGDMNASFAVVNNRTRLLLAGIDAHIQYKTAKDLWLALADYGLQKSADKDFSNQAMVHLRYNRKLSKALRWEVFTQLQYNRVNYIKTRFLAGTGPRLKIAGAKTLHVYLATAVMYEHETELGIPEIIHRDARNSSYLSFTWLPAANIDLTATTYYQPLLKQFADYRLLSQARLKIKAGKRISIHTTWQYLYDAFPAGSSPKETYLFKTGIGYSF